VIVLIVVLWVLTLCSFVGWCKCYGELYCFHLLGWSNWDSGCCLESWDGTAFRNEGIWCHHLLVMSLFLILTLISS